MATRTIHPSAGEAPDQAPPDIATMRATVRRLLGPDDAPNVLPPANDVLDTLTATLRGHMELLAPEVEQAARRLHEESIPRFCALACVGEARRKLSLEPRSGLYGAAGHARRLARVLNALCDHYQALTRGQAVTAALRICRHCDEPITNPNDAVHVRHEPANSGPGCDIWAHREHADRVGPDPVATRILARVLIARARSRT